MREYLENSLAKYAKKYLAKAGNPEIIGITGSVGKTSAKEAVRAVLSGSYPLMASPRNMNTEIGMPLAILGLPGGGKSKWRWFNILVKAWFKANFSKPNLPQYLVLEMAADRPGDITKLTGIAPPKIGVVTAVARSHLELFKSVDEVFHEKRVMIEALDEDGIAILNRDDERVWKMRDKAKGKVISYGFHQDADVRATPESLNYAFDPNGDCGMRFKVTASGSTVPMFVPGVLGRQAAYAGMVGIAVGMAKKMNMVDVAEGLRNFTPLPGRVRCLGGIKRSIIVDDSYNASPRSMMAAMDILWALPVAQESNKIAILGDMLELGDASVEAHEQVGQKAFEVGLDMLVLVGERTVDTEKAALAAGLPREKVFHFADTEKAGLFVQERMRQGDVLLIKGSRGMRMEEVTRELMAEPQLADKLLVASKDH
jgi:UDP-N-acetylmuramoyl-tripeptide--D-alanyl-D-alanine ligase